MVVVCEEASVRLLFGFARMPGLLSAVRVWLCHNQHGRAVCAVCAEYERLFNVGRL